MPGAARPRLSEKPTLRNRAVQRVLWAWPSFQMMIVALSRGEMSNTW